MRPRPLWYHFYSWITRCFKKGSYAAAPCIYYGGSILTFFSNRIKFHVPEHSLDYEIIIKPNFNIMLPYAACGNWIEKVDFVKKGSPKNFSTPLFSCGLVIIWTCWYEFLILAKKNFPPKKNKVKVLKKLFFYFFPKKYFNVFFTILFWSKTFLAKIKKS